jgi:hypothetical protein
MLWRDAAKPAGPLGVPEGSFPRMLFLMWVSDCDAKPWPVLLRILFLICVSGVTEGVKSGSEVSLIVLLMCGSEDGCGTSIDFFSADLRG